MQESCQNAGYETPPSVPLAQQPIPNESLPTPSESQSAPVSPATGIPTTESTPETKTISEFVTHPDFPRNALNQTVDIGGYVGVVVDIVRNSIKVRSSEGITMSYNINALRRLYGPHIPAEPMISAPEPPPPPTPPPVPKREVITNPNFDAPLRSIQEFVSRPDFPKCAYGEHVDIHGYHGVVIEIVGRSLKVRSREETTRSYNADGLKKIFSNK